MLSNSTPSTATNHGRRGLVIRAMALASLAVAGFVLPFVWDVLEFINQLPKMAWLQNLLAQQPAASWFMMMVWGISIPVVLLAGMHWHGWRRSITIASMLALMWLAVTWFVHMPSTAQCNQLYSSELGCSALQWAFSMSLGLATAAYVFLMLGLAVSALGMLVEGLEGGPVHAG